MILTTNKVMTIAAAVALVPLAMVMGGCSSHLSDSYAQDQLQAARAAYAAAKADPHVEAVAPDMLLEANLALREAEKSGNADEVSHLSYVAQRKVQTARTMTEGKMAEAELQRMSKTNTALIMQKREQEARLAKQEAQMTAQQVAEARKQAEAKSAEAEKARTESQQAKAATEQARLESEKARAASEQAKSEAMHARTEQAELLREISNMKATETERGLVVTLGDVLFETGKSDISPRAKSSLDKLAEFLKNHPDRDLMIEGYTDSVGSESFNKQLSERRADAVKNALTARGVDEERVDIRGYGKSHPVATNSTAQGRQLNRRVEVIIMNQGAAGGRVSP